MWLSGAVSHTLFEFNNSANKELRLINNFENIVFKLIIFYLHRISRHLNNAR
jgi:hypothetical protein